MKSDNRSDEPYRLIRIEPSDGSWWKNIGLLWEYRELLYILAMREISLRYRQTYLGITWVIIQPLITSAIFTIIFGVLMNAPSDNISYAIFAYAGLLPWNIFSQSLQRSGISLTKDIRLITKVFFPRILIPVANSLSTLIDFFVSCVILIILMILYKTPFTVNLLTIPMFLIITMILSIGVGIIFAALNVYYRDFTYVLPFVIQIWMYASPLAYSSKIIPKSWTFIYDINPLVGIINGFRWAIFGGVEFPVNSLLYSLFISFLVFIIGLQIFSKLERRFADVI